MDLKRGMMSELLETGLDPRSTVTGEEDMVDPRQVIGVVDGFNHPLPKSLVGLHTRGEIAFIVQFFAFGSSGRGVMTGVSQDELGEVGLLLL